MKISVIGCGYVGLVTGALFSDQGHDVLCVDNNAEKLATLQRGGVPIYEPGLEEMVRDNVRAGRLKFSASVADAVRHGTAIFIAVNTPRLPNGEADLQYVEAVSRQIAEHMTEYRVIVEKSTVPVNTGLKIRRVIEKYLKPGVAFDVVSNPEFLREGSAIEDARVPDRIVIGIESDRARKVMEDVYAPFRDKLMFTDVNSSELIKHASNSFLAMKISYINAVATICELAGADVEEVARGMGLDTRIGAKFLHAGIGYGGSCFPKDVDAFERISRNLGYDFAMLREVQAINQVQRARFIKRIKDALWVVKGKKIAVLGLAFKPRTDDIREAPAADILRAMQEEGAVIRAWDPKAVPNMRRLFPDVTYVEGDIYEALRGADVAVVVTEWDDVRRLDLAKAKSMMAYPLIIDGRNVFTPETAAAAGFEYHGIGRAPRKPKA